MLPRIAGFLAPRTRGSLRLVSRAFRHPLLGAVTRARQPYSSAVHLSGGAPTYSTADVLFLKALPSLGSLALMYPHTLFGVHRLTRLTRIAISYRETLDVAPLADVCALCVLRVSGLGRLVNLASLSLLPGLAELWLSASATCILPASIDSLTALNTLSIDSHQQASETTLMGLSSLQGLTRLEMSLTGLALCFELPMLQQLGLTWARGDSAADLTPLAAIPQLTKLELSPSGAQYSADLVTLSALTQLRCLSLHRWQKGVNLRLPNVARLELDMLQDGLHYLHLEECHRLSQLHLDLDGEDVTVTPGLPYTPLVISVCGDLEALSLVLTADHLASGRVTVQEICGL